MERPHRNFSLLRIFSSSTIADLNKCEIEKETHHYRGCWKMWQPNTLNCGCIRMKWIVMNKRYRMHLVQRPRSRCKPSRPLRSECACCVELKVIDIVLGPSNHLMNRCRCNHCVLEGFGFDYTSACDSGH